MMKKENITQSYSDYYNAKEFTDKYIDFLSKNKTEMDTVDFIIEKAKSYGYRNWDEVKDSPLTGEGKYYINNRGKSCILFKALNDLTKTKKFRMIVSHLDSPRLDLKPTPFYEDGELGYLKSHFYGGIKKNQWTCVPLEMKGRIYCEDGRVLNCSEIFKDRTFVISEIAPHIADEQEQKSYDKAVTGEDLNIIIGGVKATTEEEQKIKVGILHELQKLGIEEEDFSTADIEFVPKNNPAYIGFDNCLVAGYGQDDRVCVYTSLMAELNSSHYSTFTIFADREEIGSECVGGMQSEWWYDVLSDVCEKFNLKTRDVCKNSFCISADVDGAFDPSWASEYDETNAVKINHGTTIKKCPGNVGKYDSNDANAEQVRKLINLLKKHKVCYQYGEFGKIDLGGGGTVSVYIARKNIDCIDMGVPLLSMHSPFEVTSLFDIYETYKGYLAVLGSE